MKKITILFSLMLSIGLMAQNINYNNPLPENKQFKKGVLPNGLTYYIYNTKVVKDAASYYIIQNVGSILENDDQQGLAHFLEHMAFNGTESFPDKGILNTLQKHGAVFGKDINAYTSFDETVYNMNNIPNTNELVDTCLLVLRDWSHYLSLEDKEIDAERGVIKEEWRTRQNGYMRIYQDNMATLFNNSVYAKRMPIGSMDVVENFKYKALRDFYHDWYRTDLQAIAVIGDVDVEQVESKIKALFSPIPAVKNARERFVVAIPVNDKLMFNAASDEEVSTPAISFGIRHPKNLKGETIADLKYSLLNSMVTTMLSERLREISDKTDAPFFSSYITYGNHSKVTNSLNLSVTPKPDQQYAAFEAAMKEVNRAVKFGFTAAEVDRAIIRYKNSYEIQITKSDDKSHATIQGIIQRNYLDNGAMTDTAAEYDIAKQIFDALTVEEVQQHLKKLYTDKNRYITTTSVKGSKNLTEADALQIISSAENDKNLIPYTDAFAGKNLLVGIKIKNGKLASEKLNSDTGATTFLLSNGIKVHYKFVNKSKNDVRFNAVSYGGLSLVKDADLPSAKYVSTLVGRSGLGEYSNNDLSKVLAGKTASTSISIGGITENVTGKSTTKDVTTLLQMVHLRFVKPRFDKDAYQVLMGGLRNTLISKSNNLEEKIKDSITVAFFGKDNPKQALFTQEYINLVSFETIQKVYSERFKNAADFEFFIVGDISAEQLKPLLVEYIASIPTQKKAETYKDNSTEWLSKKIKKEVLLEMKNPKSAAVVSLTNHFEYSLKNALLARTLGDMLKLRFTTTLREEEGGTYGANAYVSLSKRPVEKATIIVEFDSNPEKVDRLLKIVNQEIAKIADGTISQSDLDKTITNYQKERAQDKSFSQYDMNVLTNFFREGYDMNASANFDDIVKNISVKELQDFTVKILKEANTAQIIINPLNKE